MSENAKTDKLVEVGPEAHALLKAYCAEHGHDMRAFLSGVIVNEVKRQREEQARIQLALKQSQ